jgi:uncharacterized membrane protein
MRFRRLHPPLRKSLAFGLLHLLIAVTVGWLITGSFVLASALAIVEPLVNTVAHYFFDRWWDRAPDGGGSPIGRQPGLSSS